LEPGRVGRNGQHGFFWRAFSLPATAAVAKRRWEASDGGNKWTGGGGVAGCETEIRKLHGCDCGLGFTREEGEEGLRSRRPKDNQAGDEGAGGDTEMKKKEMETVGGGVGEEGGRRRRRKKFRGERGETARA
uniref:Uncharacterized protein n=1 Tax=Cucumis melo TaxID=3656 RepID=A0A9I9CCT0_CUCME